MKVQISTSLGAIVLELDTNKAPKTVENFVRYVESGHYAGTIFHRVIDDFMIQGGGLDAELNTLATREPIRNEANNGLSNVEGSIAMARTSDPHSAAAQFFINTNDNAFLDHQGETDEDWGYCVFGKVVAGAEVVEQIGEVPTATRKGHQDVPQETILIERVEVLA